MADTIVQKLFSSESAILLPAQEYGPGRRLWPLSPVRAFYDFFTVYPVGAVLQNFNEFRRQLESSSSEVLESMPIRHCAMLSTVGRKR